jgi:hypothetical protein
MQQFTVPQFIDVEDKIIGPITARQFIIMLAGFLLIALCYKIFAFNFFLFFGLMLFAISGIFAFLKVNGMPFHFFVLNFIQTLKSPNLRVWNNRLVPELRIEKETEKAIEEVMALPKQKVSTSRLTELSLIVDTQGAYKGEVDWDTDLKSQEESSPASKITKDFAI